MRAIQLGHKNTLIVISRTELETLHSKVNGSISLLEDRQGAPGYAIMVDTDAQHAQRSKPPINETSRKKRLNNAGKKRLPT